MKLTKRPDLKPPPCIHCGLPLWLEGNALSADMEGGDDRITGMCMHCAGFQNIDFATGLCTKLTLEEFARIPKAIKFLALRKRRQMAFLTAVPSKGNA